MILRAPSAEKNATTELVQIRSGHVRIKVGTTGRPTAVLAQGVAPQTVGSVRARTYIWHVWPGRNWPLTATEETAFVNQLIRRAKKTPAPKGADALIGIGEGPGYVERGVVTALMNALRCGLSVAELFERAPGLRAHELLFAYRHIEAGRKASLAAFDRIVEGQTLEAIVMNSSAAQTLMSVPVRQMTPSGSNADDEAVVAAVARVLRDVTAVTEQAVELEDSLSRFSPGDGRGVEIGRMLYDPYSPTLWSSPYYRPRRVGDLAPLRVADLLGERRP